MDQNDEIKQMRDEINQLLKDKHEQEIQEEVDEKVRIIVKARCALAWASILAFVFSIGSILTFYSDTVKLASKAAFKVIVERIWE